MQAQRFPLTRFFFAAAGGGDTLQELKSLNPGLYHAAIDNSK
jgi:hypothetical protein